jgi:hypothetical protein
MLSFLTGPVLMTQMIAMTDAAFAGIGSGCTAWMSVGFLLLLFGPLGFLVLVSWRIFGHIKTGDLKFEASPRPTMAGLRVSLNEAPGCFGKVKALKTFYGEWRAKGEWNSDNLHARHYTFVLGDMSKLGAAYAIFLLAKRIYMTATLELSDGSLNAGLCVFMQTLDSILLSILRPFNDGQATTTEIVAGFSNVAAYVALGLPGT